MGRTGPRNLPGSGTGPQPRSPKTRPSRASMPSFGNPSAGHGPPPGGAAGGIPKATSPMAPTPSKKINKSKTGSPRRSSRLGMPRADFPSKI